MKKEDIEEIKQKALQRMCAPHEPVELEEKWVDISDLAYCTYCYSYLYDIYSEDSFFDLTEEEINEKAYTTIYKIEVPLICFVCEKDMGVDQKKNICSFCKSSNYIVLKLRRKIY